MLCQHPVMPVVMCRCGMSCQAPGAPPGVRVRELFWGRYSLSLDVQDEVKGSSWLRKQQVQGSGLPARLQLGGTWPVQEWKVCVWGKG